MSLKPMSAFAKYYGKKHTRPMALTRNQVLISLAATALFLLVVAQLWSWMAGLPLVPALHLDLGAVGVGITLGLGINGLSTLAYYLWPQFRKTADEYLALVLTPLVPSDMFWLGLLPGLSEEILFRGIALSSWGLIASSLLFGALHLMGLRHWPYAFWAILIGFILGGAMVLTGNLLVPVCAHVTNNWLAGYLWHRRQAP
jgi:uncharacterized protein